MNTLSRIVLVGGGTLGSATPLLAVSEFLGKEASTLWIGSRRGPERNAVKRAGIPYRWIFSGKLRRYAHWRNIVDPFLVCAGFFQSLFILWNFRPSLVYGTGSFIQVPVMLAARCLGIQIVIHQLDIEAGLANRLCAPLASKILLSWEIDYLFRTKTGAHMIYAGYPIRRILRREVIPETERRISPLPLDASYPTILAMGGSLGAEWLNHMIRTKLRILTAEANLIHITGRGNLDNALDTASRYWQIEFVEEAEILAMLYHTADLVVSRAGMSTLAELAALGKPALLIPLSSSTVQQIANARYLEKKDAAEVLLLSSSDVRQDDEDFFAHKILRLLKDSGRLQALAKNIKMLDNSRSEQMIISSLV